MDAITLPELRKLSNEFRQVASRALRSDHRDARRNLTRLLQFVRSTPLLESAVTQAPPPERDVIEVLRVAQDGRDRLDLPLDPQKELGFLHALIVALAEEREDEFWRFTHWYGGKTSLAESVRAVLHDTVGPYTTSLNGIIAGLLIDHSDSARAVDGLAINVSGGNAQVNIARDHGRIVAKQKVGDEVHAVLNAASRLLESLNDPDNALAPADRETMRDLAEAVAEEVEKPRPKKMILGMLRDRLLAVSKTVEAGQIVGGAAQELGGCLEALIG